MATIDQPEQFSGALRQIVCSLHEVLDLAREVKRSAKDRDFPEPMFDTAEAFKYKSEFFEVLIDFLRVLFDANPPGTMFLNANPDVVWEVIGGDSFEIGYFSGTGKTGESVTNIYKRMAEPVLRERGYPMELADTRLVFAISGSVSARPLDKVSEILRFFEAGITPAGFLSYLAGSGMDETMRSAKGCTTSVGFGTDPSLGGRHRLSMWVLYRRRTTAAH